MQKKDVQELYNKVKREKHKSRAGRKSLIDPPKPKSGCKTCGKVTWKPYK